MPRKPPIRRNQDLRELKNNLKSVRPNVINSTANGALRGGFAGAAVGFINSAYENHSQMAADRRAREYQSEQSDKQFHRQQYFDNLEKRWNSEQAQLSRMKMAGLNPNLLYGELSASTVSTPTPPLAGSPNGASRDYDIATGAAAGADVGLDTLYKKAVIDNTNQNTAQQVQDTLGKNIENRYKEAGIIQTLTEQIERINKLRADIEKTGADTKTVDALRDNLVEQLNQEIELLKQKQQDSQQGRKESEQRIEESKQNVTESKQNVTESKQRVTKSKQDVTESKQRVEESKQNVLESKSREDLNRANERLRGVELKDLLLKYHLDNDQYQLINKYVHEHDLPPGSEKAIIEALHNFAESTGKEVPKVVGNILTDWLSASTWLNYINQENRTEAIKNGQNESVDGTYTPSPNNSTSNTDNSLNPNSREFEGEYDRAYTPNQKRYIDVAREKLPYLNQSNRQEYERWLLRNKYSTQYERAAKVQQLFYKQFGIHDLNKIRGQ